MVIAVRVVQISTPAEVVTVTEAMEIGAYP